VTTLPILLTALLLAGDEPDVKAELIPTTGLITPGGTTLIAAHLKLEPGWHVYWENPGDSGLATTVQAKAPEGFDVGTILYPVPERIEQPGGLVCYGYEDKACLFVQVTAPEKLEGDEFPITVEVQWLVCDDVCFYGEAKLSTKLIRAKGGKLPAPDERLKPHLDRLPQPLSSWPGAEVELTGSATKPVMVITLPPIADEPPGTHLDPAVDATFYFCSPPSVKTSSLQIANVELLLEARLSCTFLPSEDQKTPTIRGVLSVTTRSNTQKFLSLEPKRPSKAKDS